jgi:hypothetical protein
MSPVSAAKPSILDIVIQSIGLWPGAEPIFVTKLVIAITPESNVDIHCGWVSSAEHMTDRQER